MLRKLWVTCAVSLIAGVLLFPKYAGGGNAVTPSNIPTDLTGNSLSAPGGIVAGSPTGGNETAGTINVATGDESDESSTATCLGRTATAINGINYSACYHYVKLSTSVAPVNTSAATWQYTLASPISAAAATMLVAAGTPIISGYTGSAAGNNGSFRGITGATTTTISVTNATGTTANTGTPIVDFTTWDVRTNLCLQDAANSLNGNTTGVCDGSGEPGTVNAYNQITVGDGTHTTVWRMQPNIYAQFHLSGGRKYAIFQEGVSNIICPSAQNSGCQINNFSGTSGMYALYGTGNTTGYRNLDGVWFKSIRGGTLASGNVCIIQAGYDGSTWNNMQCIDDAVSNVGNGTVAVIGGNTFCCHTNFYNDTFDSEWGQTAVDIEPSTYNQVNTVNFNNTSINTHGPTATGNPNLLCHDPTPGIQSIISFTGTTYMEGQKATMTAPFIQDNGCRALEFTGALTAYPLAVSGGTTSSIIDVSNAFDTTLNLGNVVAYGGNGSTVNWTYPVTIVEQHNVTADCGTPPCAVAVTDSAGNSPGYHSRTSQFDNVTVGGNLVVKALQQSFTIAASTKVGYVMSMTTTPDTVQVAGPGSTNNVGIATTVGGTNRKLYVATQGKILTVFDGKPVVGDIACAPPASTGTVGLAHDNGATACPAGQKLGVVIGQVSGAASGATATVLLEMGN